MQCSRCKRQFSANDWEVLVNLPPHIADEYPVETTCAINSNGHTSRNAYEVFSSIMITYANGELCSKLLCDAINRAYFTKIKACYSLAMSKSKEGPTRPYIEKDGAFIRQCPPLGDTLRDLYNTAASSNTNLWHLSDFERNTREIQGVKCDGMFAQDHTFEPIKNYLKGVGAKAAWDAATQTGEIASVALVPSTKTEDFAHAAQALLKRPHFNPKVMHSDAWPNKSEYWESFGSEGRLGLFHYQKRIISTKILQGSYCQAFTERTIKNDLKQCTLDTLFLTPMKNKQGGYVMLNLATNKEITSTCITQVPITDLVIRTVEELAAQDGMMPLKIENRGQTMICNNDMLPGTDYEEDTEPVTAGHDPTCLVWFGKSPVGV